MALSVSGAVLAGGASRRMGVDKAWRPLDGQPAALVLADRLGRAGLDDVFLVTKGAPPRPTRWRWVDDRHPDHHPLHGVAAALREATEDRVLVVACDLLQVDDSTLRALLAHPGPVVAAAGEDVQPLLAVLHRSQLAEAEALARAGASAHRLVRDLPRLDVPAAVLHNANTPEQWPAPPGGEPWR